MRKVSAAELLQLVSDGGTVQRVDTPAPTIDLAELVAAVQSLSGPVDLAGLIEAVRGIQVQVTVPEPSVTVVNRQVPWTFTVERNVRGQIERIDAEPINGTD